MPRPWRNMRAGIEADGGNEYKRCEVAGCQRYRYWVARYCRLHRQRRKRYGDARVTHAIRRGHYGAELAEVRNFLKLHQDHAGVLAGLRWIEGFLHTTPEDSRDTMAGQLSRLRRHDVQPREVLEEYAALWLFLQRNPFMVQADSI